MMDRYEVQGTEVIDTLTGERAGFLSEYGANIAALKPNCGEVEREELGWESPRFVVEGKTVIDLAWDRVAEFSNASSAASSAYYLNKGESRTGDLFWDRRSKVAEEAPRYVVDSTDPDCYRVRDTVLKRYAPFATAALATAAVFYLNSGEASERFGWTTDATHEELSRKDESDDEPELEGWERELIAAGEPAQVLFTAEAYTDEVDGRTIPYVRDSSNDTFAPMNSPFDAAVWVQRLNADKMESRKLPWLDGEPSDYFE